MFIKIKKLIKVCRNYIIKSIYGTYESRNRIINKSVREE